MPGHFHLLCHTHRLAVVAAALVWSMPVSPSVTRVYEWQEPDGTIALSNAPPPPSIKDYKIRDVEVPPTNRSRKPPTSCDRPASVSSALASDDRAVAAAQADLARARHERAAGVEPLPGERRGKVGGGSRLTQEYFDRQARLEQFVRQAETDLRAAFQRRAENVRRIATCEADHGNTSKKPVH